MSLKDLLAPAFVTLDIQLPKYDVGPFWVDPLDAAARRVTSLPMVTVGDLQVVLNSIEYRGGLMLMRARVLAEEDIGAGFRARAMLSVPDREWFPASPTIDVTAVVAFIKPVYATTLLQVVRDTFARMLLHELCEGITV